MGDSLVDGKDKDMLGVEVAVKDEGCDGNYVACRPIILSSLVYIH